MYSFSKSPAQILVFSTIVVILALLVAVINTQSATAQGLPPIVASPVASPIPGVCNIGCQIDADCATSSSIQYECVENQCRLPANPQAQNCLQSVQLGDTMPDAYVNYEAITFNDPQQVSKELDYLMAAIEDGYGMGFQFSVDQGQEVAIHAREVDSPTLGSYIKTKLYDPDGQEVFPREGQTRDNFTAQKTGVYTIIVRTFDWKQGEVRLQVFDPELEKLKVFLRTEAAQPLSIIDGISGTQYVGRQFFFLEIIFPSSVTVHPNNTISYFSRVTGDVSTLSPDFTRASEGNAGASESVSVTIAPGIFNNAVYLRPTQFEGFDKGYFYNLAMQYVFSFPGVSGTEYSDQFASFSPLQKQSDLDNDLKIDIRDYSILSSEFLKFKAQYDADLNGDRRVNLLDYSIFVREYTEYQNTN